VATVLRPPVITRLWSRDPAGVATRAQSDVWQNQLLTNLRSQDALPVGGPDYDYPNPRGPARASDLRTWLWPVQLNLLGQDLLPSGGPDYDWPNPRGPLYPITLRTWTKETPFFFAPQPFFGLAGHPNFDQPNPRGPLRAIDLITWAHPLPIVLYALEETAVINYDWPNPKGSIYANFLRGWINQGILPRGRVEGTPTLCFTSDMETLTCGASDSPSGQNWSGSGYMARYEIDTSLQIEGVFLDSLNNVYIDPTEVQLFVLDPNGAQLDYSTLDGTILKEGVGHYTFTFVPGIAGTWTYKWQGTGVAPATSPDTTFTINSSTLVF